MLISNAREGIYPLDRDEADGVLIFVTTFSDVDANSGPLVDGLNDRFVALNASLHEPRASISKEGEGVVARGGSERDWS